MNDSQNCIDRIGIRCLPDPPATSLGIPFRPKISSSHRPSSVGVPHFHVGISIDGLRRDKIDVKLDLAVFVITHKSFVAILQKLHEIELGRIDTNRYISDFDHYSISGDINDWLWQGQSKVLEVCSLLVNESMRNYYSTGTGFRMPNQCGDGTITDTKLRSGPKQSSIPHDEGDLSQQLILTHR